MTPTSFFEHHGIAENPFRGEEARQDPVLARLVSTPHGHTGSPLPGARGAMHPELERIAGDLVHASSAVVFGEKGAGKTAIRLQLAHGIDDHNAQHPDGRVFLLAHDDLNPMLDRLHNRLRRQTRKGESTPADSFKQVRLVDHIDGMLCTAVPRLVDAVLAPPTIAPAGADAAGNGIDLGPDPRKALRKADAAVKRDLLTLQTVYDRPDEAPQRTRALRRSLGVQRSWVEWTSATLAVWGWLLPALVVLLMVLSSPEPHAGAPRLAPTPDAAAAAASGSEAATTWRIFLDTITSPARLLSYLGLGGWDDSRTVVWSSVFFLTVGLWLVFLIRRSWTDRFRLSRLAHRVYKQVRVSGRTEGSIRESLRDLPARWRSSSGLPVTDSEDQRLRMLTRLRSVLALFGYRTLTVIVDRVDEPSLVAGDPDKMRSVVWPLLSNKFLQQEHVGIKLLLPIELRHMLFRESAAFFQQARMDKQNLVEALTWTGPMLFDLCTARIAACRVPPSPGAPPPPPLTLADLFAEDVGRELIVESLAQMSQPRDAFKLVYQCVMEFCASASEYAHAHRIPKHVLESVRKQQAERVRQLAMGIRPA